MDKDTKALKRKYRILLLGLLLLAAAAAGTAVWALFFRDRPVELSPEHLPQSIDTYAEPSQEGRRSVYGLSERSFRFSGGERSLPGF